MAISHEGLSSPLSGTPPENYERFFVPAIGRPLAIDLVEAAVLAPGEHVLDVACGTGIVARLASERVGPGGTVVGLDVNPGMLGVARASEPKGATLEWRQADAEKMPFSDGLFDAVLCQMGLQFMEDPLAALREMRRVLGDGGRLLLNVPGPAPSMFEIFADAMGRHIAPPAAGFVLQVFSLHDTEEICRLLTEAGFGHPKATARSRKLRLPRPREFLWQYVHATPLADIVSKADHLGRAALETETVQKWKAFEENGGMDLNLRVLTATAQR